MDDRIRRMRKRLGYDDPPEDMGEVEPEDDAEPEDETEDEEGDDDRLEKIAAALEIKLDGIGQRLANLPQPSVDMAPVGSAISRLETAIRESAPAPHIDPPAVDLAPISHSIAAGQAELAKGLADLVAVVKVMAKDIADMRRAATAPRHILTDINGNPTGVRIGD